MFLNICPSVFVSVAGIRLEFVKPIKDVTVKERETAEFSVELSHDKISVVWYKNDVRLHPSKVVHMSDHGKVHTLAFKEVVIDDTSMIKVDAMDKTVTAMLTVIGQCLNLHLSNVVVPTFSLMETSSRWIKSFSLFLQIFLGLNSFTNECLARLIN